MIGLDTNILVRYIVQDDAAQAAGATRLIESQCRQEEPGFIAQVVLVELCWVLGRGYGYDRETLVRVITSLLSTAELCVQDADAVWLALRAFERGGADFADYLIGQVNRAAGCETTWTLDRKAGKSEWHRLLT